MDMYVKKTLMERPGVTLVYNGPGEKLEVLVEDPDTQERFVITADEHYILDAYNHPFTDYWRRRSTAL